MKTDYLLINSEGLKLCLKKRHITQMELAQKIGVTTKTIQRWVNGHIHRAKKQTLEKICNSLSCHLNEITQSSQTIRFQTKNRVLEELFAKDIIHALGSSKQWTSYLNILKEFENISLHSEQETQLFLHLGYVKYQLGLYRSAKRDLNKALHLARVLQNQILMIKSLCYLSSDLLVLGECQEAEKNIEEALILAESKDSLSLIGEIFYRKAKIHLTKNDFLTAKNLLKKSIIMELRKRNSPKVGLSIKYIQLARLELRRKNYLLACKYYRRAEQHAHRWNLRIHEAVSLYGQAITGILLKQKTSSDKKLRLARRMVGSKKDIFKNQKLLQIEFIFSMYEKNYAQCDKIIRLRYNLSRRSKLLLLNTIKMSLLLEKVSKGKYPMKLSWKLQAKKFLETLSYNVNQEQYRKLFSAPTSGLINFEDIIEFLVL